MLDKRGAPRITKTFSVKYWPMSNLLGSSSATKDISSTGVRIPLYHRLEPGIEVKLNIQIEDSKDPFETTGQVRWLKKIEDLRFAFEAGIEFSQPSLYVCDQLLALP